MYYHKIGLKSKLSNDDRKKLLADREKQRILEIEKEKIIAKQKERERRKFAAELEKKRLEKVKIAKQQKRLELIKKHPGWSDRAIKCVLEGTVYIGMNKEQAIASWGKPNDINTTITASGKREQWCYGGSYLYFDNGALTTIQN